jgi:deoxyribonuclease V
MIVATDVHYLSDAEARAAAVVFDAWPSTTWIAQHTQIATGFAAYRPGEFFRRELPCLRPLLDVVRAMHAIEIVIVDGYVDLAGAPGLGRHLHDEMPDVAVVGVAKNPYPGAPAIEVRRGGGTHALWVSAVGIDPLHAAEHVRSMDGPHRIPTLLRRVDHLARGLVSAGSGIPADR